MGVKRKTFWVILIVLANQASGLVISNRISEKLAEQQSPPERNLLSFSSTAAKQKEYEQLMCKLKSSKEAEFVCKRAVTERRHIACF